MAQKPIPSRPEALAVAQSTLATAGAIIDKVNGYLATANIHREQLRQQLDRQLPKRDTGLTAALRQLEADREELVVVREELGRVGEQSRQDQAGAHASLGRYRELFALAPDAMVVTCRRGLVRETNQAARTFFPPSLATVVPLANFVARDHVRAFRSALSDVVAHEFLDRFPVRLRGRGRSGAIVVASARRIGSGHHAQIVWTFRGVRLTEAAPDEEDAASLPRSSPRGPASAFDALDDAFHAHYDRARGGYALDVPVFVVLPASLVLARRGERVTRPISPPSFHLIKSIAHLPPALFAVTHRCADGALPADVAARVRRLVDASAAARASLDATSEDDDRSAHLRRLLDAATAYGTRALDTFVATDLARFAEESGPLLLRSAADATRVQLIALAEAVAPLVASFDDDERRRFRVVVTGDHQARSRNLGMQFFEKLLHDAPDAAERITYAEGIDDEASALALIGTQRLDAVIAQAFFGHAKRLQQDILGDAARDQLLPLQSLGAF